MSTFHELDTISALDGVPGPNGTSQNRTSRERSVRSFVHLTPGSDQTRSERRRTQRRWMFIVTPPRRGSPAPWEPYTPVCLGFRWKRLHRRATRATSPYLGSRCASSDRRRKQRFLSCHYAGRNAAAECAGCRGGGPAERVVDDGATRTRGCGLPGI